MLTAEEGPQSVEGLSTQVRLTPVLSRKTFPLMPPGPCLGLGFTKQSSFLPFVPKLHCASVSPLGSRGDLARP